MKFGCADRHGVVQAFEDIVEVGGLLGGEQLALDELVVRALVALDAHCAHLQRDRLHGRESKGRCVVAVALVRQAQLR